MICKRLLLLLLLIQFFLDLAAPNEHPFFGNGTSNPLYATVTGGTTLIRMHNLKSKCNHHFVSMGFVRKIKAAETQETAYTILEFHSDPSGGGLVRIKGHATKRYLCFSKNGKLIDRVGKHIQCLFKEKDIAGGYIELVSAVNDRWKVGFNKKGRKLKGLFHLKPKIQNCYMFKKVRCTRCS